MVTELNNKLSSLEFKFLELQKSKQRQPKKHKNDGTPVWSAYRESFAKLYGHDPVRNARANAICVSMVDRLGEDAPKVAAFYLTIQEPQYVNACHPLAKLIFNCETIHSKWMANVSGRPVMISPRARAIDAAVSILWAFENWKTQYCARPDFESQFTEKVGELPWRIVTRMGGYHALYSEWNKSRDLAIMRAQIRDMGLSIIEADSKESYGQAK